MKTLIERFVSLAFIIMLLLATWVYGEEGPSQFPKKWIGFTHLQTNLPGGRHANVSTSRAMMVPLQGGPPIDAAPCLGREKNSWTQFAGWAPDGTLAILGAGWQDPNNAQWEEEHQTFRMLPGLWKYDSWILNPITQSLTNVTAVNRVSHYNAVSFSPDGKRLLMTSLVDNISRPYLMNLDGTEKTDVSGGGNGFTYGFNASPDGSHLSYHENYQIYLANSDGSGKVLVPTGNAFNFAPAWSPDGKWLLFVSGEHYNCHPHIVRADGSELRKIADRQGYRGVTEFLDVVDFHAGSSDTPVWSVDGSLIYYTAKEDDRVELYQSDLQGNTLRLTHSPSTTTHYHPKPSPDGKWLLYGSKRNGIRNLYTRNVSCGTEKQITYLTSGHAAMWGHWQP